MVKRCRRLALSIWMSFGLLVEVGCQSFYQESVPVDAIHESYSKVHAISLDEAFKFRHAYLHQGLEEAISRFDHDDEPSTAHLGIKAGSELIGIISIINESPLKQPKNPDVWRLRGLCVKEGHRGKGLGGLLLKESVKVARLKGAKILWGNARNENKAMFLKKGAVVDSEPFKLKGWEQLGWFYRMRFDLR